MDWWFFFIKFEGIFFNNEPISSRFPRSWETSCTAVCPGNELFCPGTLQILYCTSVILSRYWPYYISGISLWCVNIVNVFVGPRGCRLSIQNLGCHHRSLLLWTNRIFYAHYILWLSFTYLCLSLLYFSFVNILCCVYTIHHTLEDKQNHTWT